MKYAYNCRMCGYRREGYRRLKRSPSCPNCGPGYLMPLERLDITNKGYQYPDDQVQGPGPGPGARSRTRTRYKVQDQGGW